MNTNLASADTVPGFIDDLTLLPPPPLWQNPWVLLLLCVALIAFVFAWRKLRQWRRARPPAVSLAIAGEPPHEWALRRLAELRSRVDELGAYRFTIECCAVLREFIEARFDLAVRYQTTREFLEHARTHAALDPAQREWLGRFLHACDRVKFARQDAARAELLTALEAAVEFIQACAKPRSATPAAELAEVHR